MKYVKYMDFFFPEIQQVNFKSVLLRVKHGKHKH